jgi:hypothetical protein
LGNAPDLSAAQRVHDEQWGGRFPSFWYLWGSTQIAEGRQVMKEDNERRGESRRARLTIAGQGRLTFADGLAVALHAARSSSSSSSFTSPLACDYYFTHDDDLLFRVNFTNVQGLRGRAEWRPSETTPADVLLALLSEYRPMLASFPWRVGLGRYKAMADVASEYARQPVAPLTGFDNGMVLYHAAAVDFFMPFAPNGEGGLEGHWTLGAHYLQLFGPLLFRGQALCLQALAYDNTVNLDNLSSDQRRKGRRHEGDLVFHEGVRHPYEYKLNAAYDRLLRAGLKCAGCRFGRALTPADVAGWLSATAVSWTPPALLRRLNKFYDPRHPAVRDGLARLLGPGPGPDGRTPEAAARLGDVERGKPPPPLTGAAAAAVRRVVLEETRLHFTIHIFAYNRPDAFQRMWASLARVEPPSTSVTVDITVHHDLDAENLAVAAAHRALLAGLSSHLGPVRLQPAPRHRGLRDSVLAATLPQHDDEHVLLLEDDILVSPFALRFAEAALRRCLYGPERAPRLAGVSLYAQIYSEATETFLPGVVGRGAEERGESQGGQDGREALPPAWLGAGRLVAWAMPQSWGALYQGSVWRDFVSWTLAQPPQQRYLLPDSYINRWPEDISWKKGLVRFFAERHLTLVYPRLPQRLSFSTNTLAVGANDRIRPGDPRRRAMEDKFWLSLVDVQAMSMLQLAAEIESNAATWRHEEGGEAKAGVDSGNGASGLPSLQTGRPSPQAVLAAYRNLLPAEGVVLPSFTMAGTEEPDARRSVETQLAEEARADSAVALDQIAAAAESGEALAAAAKNAGPATAAASVGAFASFDRLTAALYAGDGSTGEAVASAVDALCQAQVVGHIIVATSAGRDSLSCKGNAATTVTLVAAASQAWYLERGVLAALTNSQYEAVLLAEVGHLPAATEMEYLFRTWQGHFFHHLVGDAREARSLGAARGGFHAAFFMPRRVLTRRSVLASAAARAGQREGVDKVACGPLFLAAAARATQAESCPVAVDFGAATSTVDNGPLLAAWQQCAAAAFGEERILESVACLSPKKNYGSSTPFAGLSWLKCESN